MRIIAAVAVGVWIAASGGAASAQMASSTYDCIWIAPAQPPACAPTDDAITELLHAADAYRMASHSGATEAMWAQMLAAVRRARVTLVPDSLTFPERVAAQNAGLRIARTAANHQFAATPVLLGETGRLIAWLAYDPVRFDDSDADGEIAAWFGPRETWIEERPADDAGLFHEQVYFHTRAFRMLRVGDHHFIFSQLVAIDSAWRPHVTPVVGDVEMRRDLESGQRACIAEFDAAWSRCGAPAGLRALDRLPISHLGGYVEVDADGRANCLMCHGADQVLGRVMRDLAADEVAADLARRRGRLLADLAEQLAPIRAAAAPSP
jgi:hypothetical protein